MIRLLFISIIVFISLSIFSQKAPYFLTTFYFEDGIGNRDSIDIGFDTSANDAFNPDFGETLNQTPFKSDFDVRGVHFFEYYTSFPPVVNLISKRIIGGAEKVVNAPCLGGEPLIFFIHAIHQPVTISVKSITIFEKMDCPDHNSWDFFSPDFKYHLVEPWIWAKVPGVRYGCLKDSTYTLHIGKEFVPKPESPYTLIHEIEGKGVDTIFGVCFIMDLSFYFCDEFYVGTNNKQIKLNEDFLLYPNPVSDNFIVKTNLSDHPTSCLIYDQLGNLIKTINFNENDAIPGGHVIDADDMPNGIFFLKVEFTNGIKRIKKFIKL